MNRNEYMRALSNALRIENEESKNAVLRFCEEMILDRMEAGYSEEEAIAAMESVQALAARLNSEYEEMVAQEQKEKKTAGSEKSIDPGSIGQFAAEAAEKAGKFFSGIWGDIRQTVQKMQSEIKNDTSDTDAAAEASPEAAQPHTNDAPKEEIPPTDAPRTDEASDKGADIGAMFRDIAHGAMEAAQNLIGKMTDLMEKTAQDDEKEVFAQDTPDGDAFEKHSPCQNGEAFEKKADEEEEGYRRMEYTCPAACVNEIKALIDDCSVRIAPSGSDQITLVYYTAKDDPYTVTLENGVLSLTHLPAAPAASTVRFSLRDLLGGKCWKQMINRMHGTVEVMIPAAKALRLNIRTKNGTIDAEGPENLLYTSLVTSNGRVCIHRLKAQSLHTDTSNGTVDVQNVTVQDTMVLKSSNCAIHAAFCEAASLQATTRNAALQLENVRTKSNMILSTSNGRVTLVEAECPEEINVQDSNAAIELTGVACKRLCAATSNSPLRFDAVQAEDYSFTTSNGSVTGTLPGKAEDYGIHSKTSNGTNTLPELSGGAIPLTVRTSNGSIHVSFQA